MKETVLGTITCSNPEVLCRVVQRLIAETDPLNAPCIHRQAHSPTLAAARFCLARVRVLPCIKEKPHGTMKVSATSEKEL